MSIYIMSIGTVVLGSLIFFLGPINSDSTAKINVYLFTVGIVLIVIASFRGDFTSDYSGYEYIFEFHNQFDDIGQLLENSLNVEVGFVVVNWIIGRFTNETIWIFLLSSTVFVTLYLLEFRKYSTNIFLSVLLFVTIGEYYTSFNITRQILTAAIIFAGSSYLYEKKLWKYVALVLFASLFHKTAIVMIPFYFILNLKFNYKKLIIILIALLILSVNVYSVSAFMQNFFYTSYRESSYGMSGYGFRNMILPLGFLTFALFGYSTNIHKEDDKLNIWLNATVFYVFFVSLGLHIEMLQRFSYFFLPYILLVIPKIISTEQIKHFRIVYYTVIISGSIIYNLIILSGSGYDPYYFIWNR